MNSTRRGLLLLVWALCFAAAPAQATLKLLEEAVESNTRELRLPPGGGTLVVQRCDGCDPLYLNINAQTASFIDGERVSYADLQREAERSSPAGLYVFYEPESRRVTRLLLRR